MKNQLADDLEQALQEFERAATNLSSVMERLDLSQFPFFEKDINKCDISTKAKVGKFLVKVFKSEEKSNG